jgi:hypothetical protein
MAPQSFLLLQPLPCLAPWLTPISSLDLLAEMPRHWAAKSCILLHPACHSDTSRVVHVTTGATFKEGAQSLDPDIRFVDLGSSLRLFS